MKKIILFIIILTLVILAGGSYSDTGTLMMADYSQVINGEAKILQSWRGDYPVAQLHLLPEKQREQAVGFIGETKTFEHVWKAFKPGEDVPKIDFTANLVFFARNTRFYNRISIGKVNVKNGVAEVLAMQTMSARYTQRAPRNPQPVLRDSYSTAASWMGLAFKYSRRFRPLM